MYSDSSEFASGATLVQFYSGRQFIVCDVFEMKTDKECVNTLEDTVRQGEDMDKLISDSAQVEIIA